MVGEGIVKLRFVNLKKKRNMPIMYFFFQGGGGLICREPADYGSPESVPEGRGQSHD